MEPEAVCSVCTGAVMEHLHSGGDDEEVSLTFLITFHSSHTFGSEKLLSVIECLAMKIMFCIFTKLQSKDSFNKILSKHKRFQIQHQPKLCLVNLE